MRTIAPINSGFLLSSALLILCLACTHANGEVNSKELLDDAGFDLDVESAHFLDGSSNEVGQSHAKISAGCIDCSSRQRASTETGTNKHGQSKDGKSFCYRRNAELENDPNVCYKYWAEVPGSTDRIACVKVDGKCKTGGQDMKCCGKRRLRNAGGTPPSTPSTPSASPPASAGGQQADEQADGCFFCGKPCPNDCWNAMKSRVDEVVKNGGHIYNLYGFPGTISKCTAAKNAIPGGRGNPRQVYYAALVKMGTRYYQERKKNMDWSPAGGWLQYGVNTHDYCNTWKCGPDDYAKYGRSSALGCKNTCSSFDHPDICKHAAPKCKWVPWNGWGSCKDVDQAELLQTTDNQTETGSTKVHQSELDRLLDDVQTESNRRSVGAITSCW